jgi:hypothetical protein
MRHPLPVAISTAALAAGALACAGEPGPGVLIELQAPIDERQRPDFLWLYWLAPRGLLLEGPLPESGLLPAEGEKLARLFIATRGPLAEPRVLAVRGERGDTVVCGGLLQIEPGGPAHWTGSLRLDSPLPDRDLDGIPDAVQDNCLAPDRSWPCMSSVDPVVAAVDGAASAPPDAGAADAPVDGPTPVPRPDPADAGADMPAEPPVPDAGRERPLPGDAAPPVDAWSDSSGDPVLSVGLVAHWRFDDPPGSVSVRDSSGNGNLGRLVGMSPDRSWVDQGRVGRALAVPAGDGSGVVVLPTGSIENIRGPFTIAAWTFRNAQRPDGLATVLSRPAPRSATGQSYALGYLPGGQARGFLNTQLEPGPPTVTSAGPVPLDRWVHLAMSYDGEIMVLYVDGAVVGTADYDQPPLTGSTPLCLGCTYGGPDGQATRETLAGLLDELVLYARALPATEIQRLAAGNVPATP